MRRRSRDEGQLTLLVIGYTAIAAVLVLAGVDVSKVFLARRALASVADSAALAAAQTVDRAALYAGDAGGCGGLLPIDAAAAADAVAETLDDDADDLRRTFAVVQPPQTSVRNRTVTVHLGGDVAVPFGKVLVLLDPRRPDGRVHVDVVAHAQSPIAAPGGC